MTGSKTLRPDPLAGLDRALQKITQRIAAIGVAAILAVSFLTILDIVLRNFFARSLYGLGEVTVLLIAIAVSAVLPSGMARRISHRAVKPPSPALCLR